MASGWWKKIAPTSEPSSGEGRGDELAFLDGNDDLGLGLDDDFDPFMNDGGAQPKAASGAGGRAVKIAAADIDDDVGGEEIKLTHETGNAAAKATEDIALNFQTLQLQVTQFRDRYKKVQEDLFRAHEKAAQLEEEIDELKEENSQLSFEVQQGGKGGFAVIGGAGGGKAMKNRGGIAKALLTVTEEMDVDVVDDIGADESFLHRLRIWWLRNKPLQAEYRRVSARFGASTSSYFLFYRFVFLQMSFMAIISIAFTVVHVNYMTSNGLGYNSIMGRTGGAFLPNFMLFSTYTTNEGFDYSLMVILGTLTLIASVIQHLVQEDKTMKEVDIAEVGNESPFAREVLCAWDCSMTQQQEADDQYSALGTKYVQMLEDEAAKNKIMSRTTLQLFILWSKRFIGTCLYLGIQFAAFVAIIFLTISAPTLTESLKGTPLAVFSDSLAPIGLQVINSVIPQFIKTVTVFESWDSGFVYTSILLVRQYLFAMLNNLILAMSYVLQADPFLLADQKTIRDALVTASVPGFVCTIDQTCAALFATVVTTFLVKEIVTNFLSPVLTKLATQYALGKTPPKAPFELVDSTIDTLSFVSQILLTFPFAPLSLLFGPVLIYIRIKREIWVLMHFSAKPEKPWKAHYSGVIFTAFYLMTLILLGLPACVYFLTSKTFPKNCDIQDNYVSLCAGAIDSTKNTCTTDKNSVYYDYYGNDAKNPYPKAICEQSCGAFVGDRSNASPFKAAVTKILPTETVWDILFTYPYLPWATLVYLLVNQALRKNSRMITHDLHEKESRLLNGKVELLEKEKKRIEKAKDQLKMQLKASGIDTADAE